MSEPWILRAFPVALRPEAAEVAAALPPSQFAPVDSVEVWVDGETLAIPGRIYNDVAHVDDAPSSSRARLMAACAYTRHHDGRVRQRAVRTVLATPAAASQAWVVPYVVLLVGEYVVEIVDDIAGALTELGIEGSTQQRTYGSVLAANPELFRLTQARTASYWDCYYRRRYPRFEDYPGRRLADALARAAAFSTPAPPSPSGKTRT